MITLATQNESIDSILQKIQAARSKDDDVSVRVRPILEAVRDRGDAALREFTERWDGVSLDSFSVTPEEIKLAYTQISLSVLESLKEAKNAIELFHKTHVRLNEEPVETRPGVKVWREFRSIERVGLYVPGGTASYPSTVLMTAVPAQIAGCTRMVICTPANREGLCNPAVLVAADLCGVSEIYKVGGAQAIAAMAYGTETVPKVYKIFGPGNQYVATAKIMVFGDVAIDQPAGPSEVAVIADESANPEWIAADLLSQLEHGGDSQALLLSTSEGFVQKVEEFMRRQMESLSRKIIIEESFARSFAVVVKSMDEAIELINGYAPEHLEIVVEQGEAGILSRIVNAGSIFLGPYSSEPLGDYATGSNHTIPTSGGAKMFSALSTESFGKMVQIQKVSLEGIQSLRKTVETLAYCEGLDAHARAVTVRFESLSEPSFETPPAQGGHVPSSF